MTTNNTNVIGALARVYVDEIAGALPLYESLTGEKGAQFGFRDLRLAKVGVFLLIEGADDAIRAHAATVAVRDIDAVVEVVRANGGDVVEGPAAGPNGARLIAAHADGNVVEYIESPR